MKTTAINKIPYAEDSDAPDYPTQGKEVAELLDTLQWPEGNIKDGAISLAKLAAAAKPLTWYTPKIIAAEEARTNVAYGKLGTPDEISGVVLPTNGLMLIGYSANVKNSAAPEGRAAIFIGANQLKADQGKTEPTVQECQLSAATTFHHISTYYGGLIQQPNGEVWGGDVTTGQVLSSFSSGSTIHGGPCIVFAAAGTYTISVQFKAASGSVTAKERKLWVAVLGS